MKTVLQDIATAVMGLGIFLVTLVLLPMLMPAGVAYILSIVLFIVVLTAGGYILSASTR